MNFFRDDRRKSNFSDGSFEFSRSPKRGLINHAYLHFDKTRNPPNGSTKEEGGGDGSISLLRSKSYFDVFFFFFFLRVHGEFITAKRFSPGIYDGVKIAEIVTLITRVTFPPSLKIHGYF